MNASYLLSAFAALIELAVLVVGVVLVRTRTSGSRRTLGVLGLVVLAVVVIVRGAGQLSLPLLFQSLGPSFSALYGVFSAAVTLVWIGGLGLVIAALVARDRPAPPPYPNQPYPNQPYPNQPYPTQ